MRFIQYKKLSDTAIFTKRNYFVSSPYPEGSLFNLYENQIYPTEKFLAFFLNTSPPLSKFRVFDENNQKENRMLFETMKIIENIAKNFKIETKTRTNEFNQLGKMEEKALFYGFSVVDVDHDGNCLFNAISHQLKLKNTYISMENLREKTIFEIIDHPNRYNNFCNDDENLEDYITNNLPNG